MVCSVHPGEFVTLSNGKDIRSDQQLRHKPAHAEVQNPLQANGTRGRAPGKQTANALPLSSPSLPFSAPHRELRSVQRCEGCQPRPRTCQRGWAALAPPAPFPHPVTTHTWSRVPGQGWGWQPGARQGSAPQLAALWHPGAFPRQASVLQTEFYKLLCCVRLHSGFLQLHGIHCTGKNKFV